MFHQPPAGPKHTSAHWRSSGGVIKLLNGSQKSRREAGEGTTNRLSKSWPGDVSASWVATSLVATEAEKQHLEREMLCYPDRHRDRETIKIDTQSKHQRGPALMLSQTREEIVPEGVVTEQGIYRKFHMEN
ncbi:unnamed protein product [Leuciscus chuanchicus]